MSVLFHFMAVVNVDICNGVPGKTRENVKSKLITVTNLQFKCLHFVTSAIINEGKWYKVPLLYRHPC